MEDALKIVEEISSPVDVTNTDEMMTLIKSTIGTKFTSTWSDLMCKLALDAVRCVAIQEEGTGKTEVDIKRYARVEKVNNEKSNQTRSLIELCLSLDPRW